ncbi:putative transposase, Ptta/En/Spm, plant, transposase, Tnp1/En/Spm [Rosa chinensis]|uniref:Putative transposase, Ptta/En/Spm, plant, transposase, Tnp1/En/Spm n=1 Tax=Rosa chinensis TaxID=74649 RepID=A0A2P6QUV6_ROSCH|nr:putative transposase, Ptta/En/Spm, plant, transposase, Tnp1/En/Spm [Rosa chinensis]
MAPSKTAAKAKAIALRMKAVQMKRCSRVSKAVGEDTAPKQPAKSKKPILGKTKVMKSSSKAGNPKKGAATSTNTKDRSNSNQSVSKRSVGSKSKKVVVNLKSGSGSKHGRSKKPDDDDENVTGGLKLLKRGMVTMNRITKRLIHGRRMKVEFNAQGEPIGKAAKEMQSYIGVLARTKIPISIQDWREVDVDEKDKIWESIQDAFVVPKEWKKLVITSAANKWREFKSKLTKLYIIPYLETPEFLQFPPDDYRSIDQEDWDIFVADRTSHAFQELRHAQILKRKENKYPHRMARKGYANLQEELSESTPIEELDRATMWIKARQDKTGSFNGPVIEKAAEKIEIFKKRVFDGEITTSGSDDVLTLALGSPEYPGRVRGVGGFFKPHSYFNLPKRQKQSVEVSVRISVRKILAEERQSIIAEEKAKWDFEREQQIERERAMWEERLRKLESKVGVEEVLVESPKPVTAVNELGSATGSCSRKMEQALKVSETEATKIVKKKLDLAEEAEKLSKDNVIIDSNASKKLTSINQEKVRTVRPFIKDCQFWEEILVQSTNVKSEFKLATGSVDNIVAFGTIVEVDVEATQQTIHGVPLGEENVRVSVTKVVVANALLPFPIKDEIVRVADAIGTCVAWPRSLVIPPEVVEKSKEIVKL